MTQHPSPPAPLSSGRGLLPPGLGTSRPTPPSQTTKLRASLAAVALVLVSLIGIISGIIAFGSSDDSAAAPPPSTTARAASVPIPVTTPPPSTSTEAADADFPGWRTVYTDMLLGIPAAPGVCAQPGIDFDTPTSQTTANRDSDLAIKAGCGDFNTVATGRGGQAWGHSVTGKTPDSCRTDALGHPILKDADPELLAAGTEYCLITGKNSVVWFRITADDEQDRQLISTLWARQP